ncbi:MAG TPA: GntR family transcriptional regulator [Chloroflexota bacterium]|nr:GntR family transcriptional regulator [Chloroflexota bacterium]
MQAKASVSLGPSLQAMVYERILDAIIRLDLLPGERLVEGRLAARLGVSRVPVREAIRQLEREQLVVVNPRRGATVAPLTPRDANEVYTLRITLEALAARLAAENAGGEHMRVMEEMLQRAAEVASQDPEQFYVYGAKFHAQVVLASGNEKLAVLLRVIGHHVARLRMVQARSSSPEIRQRSMAQHDAIYKAIARRQAARAERLMAEHVRGSRDRIVPLLDSMLLQMNPAATTGSATVRNVPPGAGLTIVGDGLREFSRR